MAFAHPYQILNYHLMLVHHLPELWMLDKIFKVRFFQSCVFMSYLKALREDMWNKMETVQMLPVTKRDSKVKERSLIWNSTFIRLQRPEPQNRQMQNLEKQTSCKHIQQDWSSVKSTKHMALGAEHHRPQITQGVVGYSKRVGFLL